MFQINVDMPTSSVSSLTSLNVYSISLFNSYPPLKNWPSKRTFVNFSSVSSVQSNPTAASCPSEAPQTVSVYGIQVILISASSYLNHTSKYVDMDLCCLIDSKERLAATDLVTMLGDLLERGIHFPSSSHFFRSHPFKRN